MGLIDPKTFLFVANLLGILFAFVLAVQARSFPDDIDGLRDWARAVTLISVASGLAAMRGLWPDLVSIVLSSACLLLGQLLLIFGLLRYNGRRPAWRPALDGIGAVLLLILWLTYGAQHYQGRIFLMALAQIAFCAAGAYLAWRAAPAGFGSRFLTGVFVVSAAVALWRIGTLPSSASETDDLFDHDLIQQIYLGMFSLGVIALAIGFILITNERLRVELEFMATRDPMTGSLNRRAFFARADIEWARARRANRPLTVITSDIDFFKKVNDTHGHHIGDLVIKDFAQRATAQLRLPDILARFGGEEFVIVLPETGLTEGKKVAERIRREIEQRRDAKLPAYTVSLGLAASSNTSTDLSALLAEADAALYRAKQSGRNRVET